VAQPNGTDVALLADDEMRRTVHPAMRADYTEVWGPDCQGKSHYLRV